MGNIDTQGALLFGKVYDGFQIVFLQDKLIGSGTARCGFGNRGGILRLPQELQSVFDLGFVLQVQFLQIAAFMKFQGIYGPTGIKDSNFERRQCSEMLQAFAGHMVYADDAVKEDAIGRFDASGNARYFSSGKLPSTGRCNGKADGGDIGDY